jgi:hypothetical protein
MLRWRDKINNPLICRCGAGAQGALGTAGKDG